MEFSAKKKNIRVTTRKLRLLADLARGKPVEVAIDAVKYSAGRQRSEVVSLLRSAVHNATQARGVDIDTLFVKSILVDKGPTMKRIMARARGSAAPILKRTSHLTIILATK